MVVNPEDIRDAEENGGAPSRYQEEDGRDKARDAERQEFDAVENEMGYRGGTPKKGLLGSRRNKAAGWIAGVGTAGILMLFGLGALLPFKINGLLSMITDEAGQRVEQITIHRAKVIMARAILSKVGVNSSPVITGNGPLSSLIATLRTNKLEEKLAAKGLKIVQDGNGVKLSVNGEALGSGTLRTEKEVLAALDGKPLTAEMINTLVREEIPWYRALKRMKFSKFLRLKYDIPRFGKEKSKETDPEKKKSALQTEEATTAETRTVNTATEAIDCLGSDKCGTVKPGDKPPDSNIVPESQKATSQAAKTASERATEAIVKAGSKVGVNIATETAKVAAETASIVLWVSLASQINHIVLHGMKGIEDGTFAKGIGAIKGKAYAQIYGDWAGFHSQIQLGEADTDYIGIKADELTGAEQSRTFACIDAANSPSLTLLPSTVSAAADCANKGIPIEKRVDENNPAALQAALKGFQQIAGMQPSQAYITATTGAPLALEAYYYTLGAGGLEGWLTSLAGDILQTIASWATPPFVKEVLSGLATTFLPKVMSFMLDITGMSINRLATGASLFSNMGAGATFSLNNYCREALGCDELTKEQAAEANRLAWEENRAYVKSKGLLYALFSPDYTSSITTRLAIATPTENGQVSISKGFTMLMSGLMKTPAQVYALTANSAHAAVPAGYVDLYGISPQGYPVSALDMPLSDEVINDKPCPTDGSLAARICLVDKEVIQVGICTTDGSKIETPECNVDADTSVGTAAGSCPVGTNLVPNITKGWDKSGEKAIALCTIPGTELVPTSATEHWSDKRYEGTSAAKITQIVINSEAAAKLLEATQKAASSQPSVKLTATISYRSLYEQCSIVIKHLKPEDKRPPECPAWIKAVPGDWNSTVIVSNHMMGYSMDLTPESENWMKRCVGDATDGASDNRCYGFYDDVLQREGWDSAHFTYRP